MQKLDTICELAKSITTKVEKGDGGTEVVNCKLKFAGVPIPRDMIDDLLGLPVGWSQSAVFDDQGSPLRLLSLSVAARQLRVTGKISGPKGNPTLPLLQAQLSDVSLSLVTLGAIAEGMLTWTARGDEIEDSAELLGKTCLVQWEITDGDQNDMFPATRSGARDNVREIVDGLGRNQAAP